MRLNVRQAQEEGSSVTVPITKIASNSVTTMPGHYWRYLVGSRFNFKIPRYLISISWWKLNRLSAKPLRYECPALSRLSLTSFPMLRAPTERRWARIVGILLNGLDAISCHVASLCMDLAVWFEGRRPAIKIIFWKTISSALGTTSGHLMPNYTWLRLMPRFSF